MFVIGKLLVDFIRFHLAVHLGSWHLQDFRKIAREVFRRLDINEDGKINTEASLIGWRFIISKVWLVGWLVGELLSC